MWRAVELLCTVLSYSPDEMLAAAQQHTGFNPYPAKYGTVSVDLGDRTANVPWGEKSSSGTIPGSRHVRPASGRLAMAPVGVGWEHDERMTTIPLRR